MVKKLWGTLELSFHHFFLFRFEMEPMELLEQARDTWLEALHSFSPVRKEGGGEVRLNILGV